MTYNNWEFPLGHGREVSIYRITADLDVHNLDAPSRAKSPWLFLEFGLAHAQWRGVGFAIFHRIFVCRR